MANMKSIVEKIRKLIAHEKSCRAIGNIKEAEAFATKIQELLDTHKLGMDEVAFQEREQTESVGWTWASSFDQDFHAAKKTVYWQLLIAQAIAKANNCRTVRGWHSNSVAFVGRDSDRELCKIIFIYMVDLAFELCDKTAKEEKGNQHRLFLATRLFLENEELAKVQEPAHFRQWMKEFRKSWFKGFSHAVAGRFFAQAEKTQKAMSQTALVYIGKDIVLINKSVDAGSKKTPLYNRGQIRNGSGYKLGKRTGEAVNLTPHRFEGAAGRGSRLLGDGQ